LVVSPHGRKKNLPRQDRKEIRICRHPAREQAF
jgi:hypothetical protein